MKTRIYNLPQYKERRRELRRQMTPAEVVLWENLRGSQMGCRIRRQHGIGHYIVDFYCASARLVIELDGASHESDTGIGYDEARDSYLRSFGHRILRFTNQQIMKNLTEVLFEIKLTIQKTPSQTWEGVA